MQIDFEVVVQNILHIVAQALMIPVMILLMLLILVAIFLIAATIMEFFTERLHYKRNIPRDINAIHDAPYDEVVGVIARCGLLEQQKTALEIVANNMGLPDDDLFALAKAEVQRVDEKYQRKVKRSDLLTKICPMLGLMCTLIPLGPGIVAMGNGDTATLSSSLLVAFDGTVAGLVTAVVAMTVSSVRKRWYAQYLSSMEALMTSLLSKAEIARNEGVELPHNFTAEDIAQMRQKAKLNKSKKKGEDVPEKPAEANASAKKEGTPFDLPAGEK